MIRRCQYCETIYGEKEPLEDKRETHGECDLCHWLFTLWYSLYMTHLTREKATDFIRSCRRGIENLIEFESAFQRNPIDQQYLQPESFIRMEPERNLTGCRQAKASSPPSGACAMSTVAHSRKDRCAR